MNPSSGSSVKRSSWIIFALAALALAASLPGVVRAATYVKVADEWGTIQVGGPRGASNGNRFWNIEAGGTGSFASAGTLRFYMDGLKARLDADFPGGWQIDNVTMVLEQSNAAFTTAGSISVYHFTNDALAITNGADGGDGADKPPGNFGALGVSTLKYSNLATADGKVVRVTDGDDPVDMGTVTKVVDYMQTTTGSVSSGNLDVLGTTGSLVDPAGAINVTPNYGISFPAINSDDENLTTFTTELANDAGDWITAGFNTMKGDIQSGADALSFIFVGTEDDALTAGTYKGNPFTLTGDYNGDSVVDAADYTVWRDTLGSTIDLRANGDNTLDSAGVIDQADYTRWMENYGMASQGQYPPRIYIQASAAIFEGSGSGVGGVPEPTSIVLLAAGLVGQVLGRRASR